jgi:FtsP/CotA-like multicopper oxidase with cupredoxin domain
MLPTEKHDQQKHGKIQFFARGIFAFLASLACAQTVPLLEAPQVRATNHVASLTLRAVNENGRDAFAFDGGLVPPVLRVSPGDTLKIDYINDLPVTSPEKCAVNPCMDMTNLHFHGLTVSPKAPQDDVLGMIAKPGESLHYSVEIPRDHLPGLFWYHTHPHGESHRQALDGMSGAIVIEGMERYVPELERLRERVIIVRGQSIEHDPNAKALEQRLEIPSHSCGADAGPPEEIMTVNGSIRPQIQIAPNERQFWRIVNASADRYLDLQIDGQPFDVIALDGMPLAYHDPKHPILIAEHYLVAPAGRLEAIVTGPPSGVPAVLRTLCVNTGPDGDPNPAMVLADLRPSSDAQESDPSTQLVRMADLVPHRHSARADAFIEQSTTADKNKPVYKHVDVNKLEHTRPDFTLTFTEDKNGFYINRQKFAPEAGPMTAARVGTYQHWRIVNATAELHPFHIHQVHFLAYAESGIALTHPVWLDTVNVPYGGSVEVIVDFTNPVIKGMAVFHCHLLNHEDKGMMAKILIE